jgi:hypothetical protein
MDKHAFLKLLNKYYWLCIQEDCRFERLSEDRLAALLHFTRYAFERQGSPQIYRLAAREAIKECLGESTNWQRDIQSTLAAFERICSEEPERVALNRPRNPMTAPQEERQSNDTHPRVAHSLISFASEVAKNDPVALWAKKRIENNEIKLAFDSLKQIKGIGDKIASFYLRDISLLSEISTNLLSNRSLLQPIDIWTKRAAVILNKSSKKYADELTKCDDDYNLATGESNVAFWVLGSQIARTSGVFTDSVNEMLGRARPKTLPGLLDTALKKSRHQVAIFEGLLSILRDCQEP